MFLRLPQKVSQWITLAFSNSLCLKLIAREEKVGFIANGNSAYSQSAGDEDKHDLWIL